MSRVLILSTVSSTLLAVVILLSTVSQFKKKEYTARLLCIFGFIFTRPNILGETAGFLSAIFWLLAAFVWSRNSTVDSFKQSEKQRLGFIALIAPVSTTIYWFCYHLTQKSENTGAPIWPALASVATISTAVFGIYKIFSFGKGWELFKVLASLIGIESILGLFYKLVFFHVSCIAWSPSSRPWTYSVCAPGAIFVNSRLVGFSAEPAIFSAVCCMFFFMVISYVPFKNRYMNIFVASSSALGIFLSGSTTGLIIFLMLLVISLPRILRGLLGSRNLNPKSSYQFSSFVIYPLFVAFVGVSYSWKLKSLLERKFQSSPRSLTDRSLDMNIHDIWNQWASYPWGNAIGVGRGVQGISLLTESFYVGVWTIILFMFCLGILSFMSEDYRNTILPLAIIGVTCLLSEPAWANSLWLLLATLFAYIGFTDHRTKAKIEHAPQPQESST